MTTLITIVLTAAATFPFGWTAHARLAAARARLERRTYSRLGSADVVYVSVPDDDAVWRKSGIAAAGVTVREMDALHK